MHQKTKSAIRGCPVCFAGTVRILHQQRFALPEKHPLPSSYDVVCCTRCGFVYADTSGTAQDYDRYYAEHSKYADQSTGTGGGGFAGDRERLEATARDIARILPDLGARIVDIGCANGGLLAALKTLGYSHLLGIDPSPDCVANVKILFSIVARQGWLHSLPADAAPADLIVVSHVLEHVLDLRTAVAAIRSLLADSGIIYAEVPDANRYVNFRTAPFQDFNVEHINHFEPASLENLFSAEGFICLSRGTKSIESAAGVPYPALYGFFRKIAAAAAPSDWQSTAVSPTNLLQYIDDSSRQMAAIVELLTPVLTGPVIVWGTGQLTFKLIAETPLGQANIAAWVDGNPINQGKIFRGLPVLAPEALRDLPPHPIIVGSLVNHEAIIERIRRDLHLPNPIITLLT